MDAISHTLYLALALMAGTAVLVWGALGGVLRISPAASARFALANLLIAFGVLGVTQRGLGAWPEWLVWPLADLASLVALSLVRQGLCRLFKRSWPWRQDLPLLLLAALVYARLPTGLEAVRPYTALFSICAALLCAGLAWEVWAATATAFRRSAAAVLAAPFVAAALVMALRVGPVEETALQAPLDPVGALWAFVGLILLLNVCLGVCVMTRLLLLMRQRATHDPMTGLLNRRAFADALQRESARAARHGEDWALLMVDLDHFKRLNDEHGHAAGDAALMHASALLRQALRGQDALGRHGGEEFAVLLPGTGAAGALLLAERLRRQLAQTPLELAGGKQHSLTASIGVAHSRQLPSGAPPQSLLDLADRALYAAKAAGRNRVLAA